MRLKPSCFIFFECYFQSRFQDFFVHNIKDSFEKTEIVSGKIIRRIKGGIAMVPTRTKPKPIIMEVPKKITMIPVVIYQKIDKKYITQSFRKISFRS